jgi:hypothetical protein
VGAGVELDAALKPGAAGEISLAAKNAYALRTGPAEGRGILGGSAIVTGEGAPPIVDQLRDALHKNLSRVIDIFREWDEDGSGTVSKKEFGQALPMLGLRVERAVADVSIRRRSNLRRAYVTRPDASTQPLQPAASVGDAAADTSTQPLAEPVTSDHGADVLAAVVSSRCGQELFDSFDDDASGTIDYAEMNRKLRQTAGGGHFAPGSRTGAPTRQLCMRCSGSAHVPWDLRLTWNGSAHVPCSRLCSTHVPCSLMRSSRPRALAQDRWVA